MTEPLKNLVPVTSLQLNVANNIRDKALIAYDAEGDMFYDSGLFTPFDGELNAAAGSVDVGLQKMSSSGEQVVWTNQNSLVTYAPPWHVVDDTNPGGSMDRFYGAKYTVVRFADRSAIVENPVMNVTIPEDTLALSFNFTWPEAQNGVVLSWTQNGMEIWRDVRNVSEGVQEEVFPTPMAYKAGNYVFKMYRLDGMPLRVMGNSANGYAGYSVTLRPFTDKPLATQEFVTNTIAMQTKFPVYEDGVEKLAEAQSLNFIGNLSIQPDPNDPHRANIAIEGGSGSGSPIQTFTELTDTPNTYLNNGGYLVRVSSAANGLEFVRASFLDGVMADVNVTNPEAGDVLFYAGDHWQNEHLPLTYNGVAHRDSDVFGAQVDYSSNLVYVRTDSKVEMGLPKAHQGNVFRLINDNEPALADAHNVVITVGDSDPDIEGEKTISIAPQRDVVLMFQDQPPKWVRVFDKPLMGDTPPMLSLRVNGSAEQTETKFAKEVTFSTAKVTNTDDTVFVDTSLGVMVNNALQDQVVELAFPNADIKVSDAPGRVGLKRVEIAALGAENEPVNYMYGLKVKDKITASAGNAQSYEYFLLDFPNPIISDDRGGFNPADSTFKLPNINKQKNVRGQNTTKYYIRVSFYSPTYLESSWGGSSEMTLIIQNAGSALQPPNPMVDIEGNLMTSTKNVIQGQQIGAIDYEGVYEVGQLDDEVNFKVHLKTNAPLNFDEAADMRTRVTVYQMDDPSNKESTASIVERQFRAATTNYRNPTLLQMGDFIANGNWNKMYNYAQWYGLAAFTTTKFGPSWNIEATGVPIRFQHNLTGLQFSKAVTQPAQPADGNPLQAYVYTVLDARATRALATHNEHITLTTEGDTDGKLSVFALSWTGNPDDVPVKIIDPTPLSPDPDGNLFGFASGFTQIARADYKGNQQVLEFDKVVTTTFQVPNTASNLIVGVIASGSHHNSDGFIHYLKAELGTEFTGYTFEPASDMPPLSFTAMALPPNNDDTILSKPAKETPAIVALNKMTVSTGGLPFVTCESDACKMRMGGYYQFNLQANVEINEASQAEPVKYAVWVQSSIDNGATWQDVPDSGVVRTYMRQEDVVMASTFPFEVTKIPTWLRVVQMTDDTTSPIPNGLRGYAERTVNDGKWMESPAARLSGILIK